MAQWTSSDETIVTVQPDLDVPEIAILVGVGPGMATVEVRIRGATASLSVTVNGAAGAPMVSLAEATLAANAVKIEANRFNSPTECAVGIFTGRPGLLVTTYTAIRGAERVSATDGSGMPLGTVEIIAYDVDENLAVLRVSARGATGATVRELQDAGGPVTAAAFPGCGATTLREVSVAQLSGNLRNISLSESLGSEYVGGALVDSQGDVVGIVTGPNSASGVGPLNALLDAAETGGKTETAAQVAAREGHLYGAVALRSSAEGARARISPSGATAWPEIATERELPFTFAGPAGFYNADLIVDGNIASARVIRIQRGVLGQENLTETRPIAQQEQPRPAPGQQQPPPGGQLPPEAAVSGGGGFPMPIIIVAVLGGGVAALLAGGGGNGNGNGGGGGGGGGGGSGTGTLTITIPVP